MNWWLVVFGIVIHFVFFLSIFEIYFTSPLVHGMTPHSVPLPAPAKRLVLFVADGLRADKFFELDENNKSRAPYLREIVQSHGAWGVSHTRVPTESRPGHVALIAGFYEDVSAVAKGWKENPVEFDSVFNESRYTWSWGSPDILPMFAQGATGDHVHTEMYPGQSEDFAGADLANLDSWVFNKVMELLDEAATDKKLSGKLNEDKIVLFMHLLGLDTNGHVHKPHSNEYLDNIGVVDGGVEATVKRIEDFYGWDQQTAYVFTSDHGMTNWGSHGAGDPSETLTPVVAWGPGVRSALPLTDKYLDGFEEAWQMSSQRCDMSQADIAPLMATLIGSPLPLNSVGILPLDFLNASMEFKAESIFTNARQILEQFQVKMKQKQETTLTYLFTPFKRLTPAIQADRMRRVRELISQQQHKQAISECQELIDLALEGLNYYHNYDRFFLGVSIVLGFLGWMFYVVTLLVQDHTRIVPHQSRLDALGRPFWSSEKAIRLMFVLIGGIISFLLFVQSLPFTHYIYCLVPVILWHKVVQGNHVFKHLLHYVLDCGYVQVSILGTLTGLLGLEIIVLSFSYRELLSLGLVSMAVWPLISSSNMDKQVVFGWTISVLTLAVFPLLPVVGRQPNYYLVYLAGLVAFCSAVFICLRKEILVFQNKLPDKQTRIVTVLQLVILVVCVCILWSTQASIHRKEGLPLINQILSWLILVLSVSLPVLATSHMYTRLVNIVLAFLPPYLLLSTSYEGLFFVTLCVVMFFWLKLESSVCDKQKVKLESLDFAASQTLGDVQRKLVLTDLRCAYFFIFFLIVAFFGTGNIASINSFDPSSVLCFLTVFNPFVMGALMMWKNLIPFVLVTCSFSAIHLSVNVPTQSLFLLVVLMSDFMAVNFFFLVKDYGSWLEIGTSISHFVIVMSMIIFLNVLLAVSKIFTNVRVNILKQHKHSQE